MRTTRSLRTLAVTAFASGTLIAVSFASAAPAMAGNDGSVWGVVVSHRDINLRAEPNPGSAKVGSLPPGARERIECATLSTHVNGNPYWYWLGGGRGWASGAYMKPERQAPMCDDTGRNQHQNRGDWNQHRDNRDQSRDPGRHHDQNRDEWSRHRNDADSCWSDCQCQDSCREH
ncbi:SH3 domain-containing protein [Streptomyces luteolus]|uniref:SH3 domain-containing protein n=1 Tax=Streptomyces luteolus TaxID=3043615 RepID=A0ABT6SZU9_9ACTN|nr:SH3 domain-containing protein [Streptomyces sp. B-S-A12]MDI3420931.1 SH3 domain-containing protein [Streptomyces sp. B-S-A12]